MIIISMGMLDLRSLGDRSRNRLRSVVLIIVFTGLACLLAYLWAINPRYLTLDLPAPTAYGWHYTAKGSYKWSDTGYVYYIWRRETTVYRDQMDFSSKSEIFGYFNSYLIPEGWEPYSGSGSCPWELPEAPLLDSPADLIEYHQALPGELDSISPASICVAIWEINSDIVDGYHVVLLTKIPSRLTEFLRSWD